MQRTIIIKRQLPYPPEDVWKVIADGQILGKWFMPNDFEPIVGREFTFRKPPQKGWDGITWCQLIDYQPLKTVAYTYRGEATGEKTLACAGVKSDTADKAAKGIFTQLDTVLRFSVESSAEGTLLTLEHSGFKGLKLVIVSLVMGMGWKKIMDTRLLEVLGQMSQAKK
jgi:uncharacterized protein YndB with AHSA1/START domain